MSRKIAIEIICFMFILLFSYATINKTSEYQKFALQIAQSPLLTGFGDLVPWFVLLLETMTVLTLMIPRLRLVGLYAAFCLMVMFTAYIVAILNFSYYIPCSCGGVLETLTWDEHLIFNSVFILIGVAGIFLQAREVQTTTPTNA